MFLLYLFVYYKLILIVGLSQGKDITIPCEYTVSDSGDSSLLASVHSLCAKPRDCMHKTGTKPQVFLTIVYNGL